LVDGSYLYRLSAFEQVKPGVRRRRTGVYEFEKGRKKTGQTTSSMIWLGKPRETIVSCVECH